MTTLLDFFWQSTDNTSFLKIVHAQFSSFACDTHVPHEP